MFELSCACPLLFIHRVRMAAAQQILPLLSDTKASRPEQEVRTIATWLPNLYCVRDPLDVSLDCSGKSVLKVEVPPTCNPVRPSFVPQDAIAHQLPIHLGQVESVEKLFCMLCSDTVDAPLRRSAAEQLAVILQGGKFVMFSFKVARLLLISLKMLISIIGTSDFTKGALGDRY